VERDSWENERAQIGLDCGSCENKFFSLRSLSNESEVLRRSPDPVAGEVQRAGAGGEGMRTRAGPAIPTALHLRRNNRKRNPLLYKVLRYPNGKPLDQLVTFASDSWDGDILPLREMLIRIERSTSTAKEIETF
jgi:hypothetical protein